LGKIEVIEEILDADLTDEDYTNDD